MALRGPARGGASAEGRGDNAAALPPVAAAAAEGKRARLDAGAGVEHRVGRVARLQAVQLDPATAGADPRERAVPAEHEVAHGRGRQVAADRRERELGAGGEVDADRALREALEARVVARAVVEAAARER